VKKRISNLKSKIHKPEIVLANDPSGAFSRQLGKLAGWPPADLAGSGEKRSRGKKVASDEGPADLRRVPSRVASEFNPQLATDNSQLAPYEMNGSCAVIPIVGPLCKYPNDFDRWCGWCFTLEIQNAIAKALDDGAVEKIILFIDSPGGMVAGTPDLGDTIAAAKLRKPVIAYVSDLCASGAYWLASQCTSIVANESAFVGSIGVYSVLVDQSKAAEEFGYRFVLVSDGEFKGLTEPGLPVGDKAVAETQRIVGSIANLFRAAVGRGRGLDESVVSILADGRVHVAAEALGLRLIDGIGPLDCAVNFAGDQNMATAANAANLNKGPAAPKIASDGTEGAAGGDGSSPDLAELCGKILDAINAQTEMIKKLVPADGGEKKEDSGSADDAAAHAKLSPQAQLKAIGDVCPGRAEFAMAQFVAGHTPMQAQAALALVLAEENKTLKQKLASEEDGAPAIRGAQPAGGGVRGPAAADEADPEKIWAGDVGGVQAAYRGNKKYFLSAFKHGQTPAQLQMKKTAAAA